MIYPQFYDFNEPSGVPAELEHSFDLIIIDPPFITREVEHAPPDTPPRTACFSGSASSVPHTSSSNQ